MITRLRIIFSLQRQQRHAREEFHLLLPCPGECHQADEDFFITFLQDGGYNDFYYDDTEEAAKFAAENLPFLDVDEVNDLIEDYEIDDDDKKEN